MLTKVVILVVLLIAHYSLSITPASAALIIGNQHGLFATSLDTDPDLVGWWTFDLKDTYGTQVYDRSGNNRTGTITGSVVKDRGRLGSSLGFPGTATNYVNVAETTWGFSTSGSVALWFKTTDTTAGAVFSLGHEDRADEFLVYNNSSANKIGLYQNKSVGNYWFRSSATSINDGKWHHLVAVLSGAGDVSCTNIHVYIDGVLDDGTCGQSGSPSDIVDTTARNIRFGNRQNQSTDLVAFNGNLDDVRLYKRALTASEVADLYSQSAPKFILGAKRLDPIDKTGLVAHWTFDNKDCNATRCLDKSTAGNDATAVSSVVSDTGKIAQGISTPTSNNALDFGESAEMTTDLDQMTVAVWAKMPGANQQNIFISWSRGDASSNDEIYLDIDTRASQHYVRYSVLDGGSGCGGATPADSFPNDQEWHHVVITKTSTNTDPAGSPSVYIDGELQSWVESCPSNSWWAPGGAGMTGLDENYIGVLKRATFIGTFSGVMDDLRVYNRILSVSEISTLYNFGVTSNQYNDGQTTITINSTDHINKTLTSGLVGHWTFDGKDMTSTRALDTGGLGNNATTTGVTPLAGKIGQALGFNLADAPTINSGLLGWWTMDSGRVVGSKIVDSSPSDRTATLNPTTVTTTGGKIQQAINFTANTQYATFSDAGMPSGTADRSASAWIKTSTSANQMFFDYGTNGGTSGRAWYLYAFNLASECQGTNASTGGNYALIAGTGGANSNVCDNVSLVDGNWHFVTVTYTGQSMKLYVDGTLKSTGTPAPADGNNTILSGTGYIGTAASSNGIIGQVDDLRFYNRVLSQAEITTLYANAPVSIAVSPSPLSTSLDTFTNLTFGTWVKYASSTGTQILMRKAATATSSNAYELKSNGTNFQLQIGTTTPITITGTTAIKPDRWYFVAGTADGSNMRLYVNGTQEASATQTGTITTGTANNWGNSLFFGSDDSPSNFLVGTLDDVRIYNRALSAAEIAELYKLGR